MQLKMDKSVKKGKTFLPSLFSTGTYECVCVLSSILFLTSCSFLLLLGQLHLCFVFLLRPFCFFLLTANCAVSKYESEKETAIFLFHPPTCSPLPLASIFALLYWCFSYLYLPLCFDCDFVITAIIFALSRSSSLSAFHSLPF